MMRRYSVKNKTCREAFVARFLIETATSRRYVCVGERSILVATGVYPVLTVAPTDADRDMLAALRDRAERFNRCYRHVVEAFLDWCTEDGAIVAREAYFAMGARAPYCFRRHEYLCNITTVESEVSLDTVRLWSTRVLRIRRGTAHGLHVSIKAEKSADRLHDVQCFFERDDTWRLPDVTMVRSERGGARRAISARAGKYRQRRMTGDSGRDGNSNL